MFDVSGFPAVPEKERFTEFDGSAPTEDDSGDEMRINKVDLEEQLRATVRKLAYCGSKLGDLPEGCTYTIAVELKGKADPPVGVCPCPLPTL